MKLEYCPICKRDIMSDEPLFDLEEDSHQGRCEFSSWTLEKYKMRQAVIQFTKTYKDH